VKSVLITGGCGFIGSHFVRRFLKSHPDWKVINFDKLTYAGNLENLRDCEKNPNYEFVQGDICDGAAVTKAISRVEAVVHFAAETHVDRSIESADDFLMTNVFGTRTLLEAARRAGIKRFLQISTDEVYGSIESGFVGEDAPLLPNSPYSASKAGADLMARAYWITYKLPVLITRSSNNFGPNQYPEKVIPLFITNLIEGKKVPLYGKGANRRDWIYVEDNCLGVEMVFDKGEPGEIYNIGSSNEMSNLELTHTLLKEMGAGEDRINPVTDRLGHDFRYGIDMAKVEGLGFKPKRSFEEGLRETIQWYRQHPQWWRPLKQDRFTIK
jgi:dTDP-glucose 4,6-dehydratase